MILKTIIAGSLRQKIIYKWIRISDSDKLDVK